MERLTRLFEWVEARLDKGAWFRRIYLIYATVQQKVAMDWAMAFATASTLSGTDRALVIGAVVTVATALMAHGFKVYIDSRGD